MENEETDLTEAVARARTDDQLVDETKLPPKKRQIMEGARHVFLERGYDGASMDEIARIAGVSKGTLYTHFDSKAALFEALIRHDRSALAEQVVVYDDGNPDIRKVLISLGLALVEMILTPHNVALTRVGIGAVGKFPEIGHILYEAGPERGISRLASYYQEQCDKGVLAMDDTRLAAMQTLQLLKVGIIRPMFYGSSQRPAPEDMLRYIESGVDMILSTYRKR
jgi:AcrR family transcriptional regulator